MLSRVGDDGDDERRRKILAIIWPITAFVTMGFEHSIANMFLIPHGMLYGADVSVSQMLLGNILPVTLGNMVGAARS